MTRDILKKRATYRRWASRNKARVAAASARYWKKNKELLYKNHRKRMLYSLYKMTLAEYQSLVVKQKGLCAICKLPQRPCSRALAVDHCHQTGTVRGLLCGFCNRAIGIFNDDPILTERATAYLRGVL